MSVNDYELITSLGNSSNTLKVRHNITGQYYVWHTVDCSNLSKDQLTTLEEKFILRQRLQHPNLLHFHELIKVEDSNIYHIAVQFCKHGSLQDIMGSVFNNNKRFTEEFLCKLLYQMSFLIKTVNLLTPFDIKNIYFDDGYNVKIFNFNITNSAKIKSPKICNLGIMIFEVCTLTKFGKKYEKELKNYNNLHSKEFLTLLVNMIKDTRDLKKNIDKIMCNSTVLLKITQWSKHKCFVKIDDIKGTVQIHEKDIYASKIEKLLEKETKHRKKESILKEREHQLSLKERKICVLEKQLKERLKELEELKDNFKKACTCSANTDQKTSLIENLDATYVSCGDSVILPTSKKLNVKEIIKPHTFTRTLSEKRIKFKGHSPLKDIDFNRRRSINYNRSQKTLYEKNSEWKTCSDDTDKSSFIQKKISDKKCKKLFHTYQNDTDVLTNGDLSKPIQWTEVNKKQAFELLRLMNQDSENKPPEVKHTFL